MLTETQIERYSRQIILPEVGGRGQERLLSASVAIVGTGPANSAVMVYLAAAGVGSMGVFDLGCTGKGGAEQDVLRADPAQLGALNPDCQIRWLRTPLTADRTAEVAGDHELVIVTEAASESREVTALLNDACVGRRRPVVWARLTGPIAWITTLVGPARHAACYRCLLPQLPPQPAPADAPTWLAALTATFAGTVLATESIKILLGVEPPLTGRLLTYDAVNALAREVTVAADPLCATCGPRHCGAGVECATEDD
jgi:molybdopterin/thiamine biosynthesis adenylyltransferase